MLFRALFASFPSFSACCLLQVAGPHCAGGTCPYPDQFRRGAAVVLDDAKIGQEQGDLLGGHGAAAVGR